MEVMVVAVLVVDFMEEVIAGVVVGSVEGVVIGFLKTYTIGSAVPLVL